MIKRIAISIVNKNTFKPYILKSNLKLTHAFSQNRKNPFQKFKRNSNNKNSQQKEVKKQQPKAQQEKKKQSINQYEQDNENNTNPISGFNKFKRNPNFQSRLNIKQKKTKQQSTKLQKQHQKSALQSYKIDNFLKKQQQKKQQINKVESNQNLKIKGFNKFKKVGSNTKENKIQMQKQQKQQKQQNIINTKKSEQNIQRQNAYKNTQKKIQEDKQQWEKFLQEQIKKQKQKNTKDKKSQIWKNFDFTNKQKNQQNNNKDQKVNQNQGGMFHGPWTPAKVMKALLFGGLGLYLGSSFIKQLLSYDNSTIIETAQLIQLLQSNQIRETWFLTSVQTLSEDSSRTYKYACVTLNNGEILKSQSNNDFEIEWNKMIDQHNNNVALFGIGQIVMKKVPIIKKDSHLFNTVRSVLSFALLFMFVRSLMSGISKGKGKMGKGLSGMFQNTKSHRFRQAINVKFNDVVGMNKAKQQIVQFIDFLKNAQKYNRLGAKIPRGALLTGPPGTGKTMLAKACAGQSGVPFFSISGSEFMQMYVGVGAQRVRNLFAEAKQAAPSIIFIDQIDAVGKKRSSGAGGGGNDQRDNTLNQLLVEMDGFDQKSNVIVFAATNQKQILDPALIRPGRFDRLIEVDLPDIEGRKQIFMVHLKPITLDQKYKMQDYAKRLATLTPGFSGADIKNLCNEAAIIAARNDKTFVSMIDFELASERIIGGVQKKSTLITPQTKRTVSYHQCGHGVVSWFMQHASPLLKLTIIPRSKGALGYAQYLPNENQVYTRKQLQDQICVILGGRIAEQIFFGKISTGASDDLQKAHKVAKAIVTQYGMSKKLSWLSYGETQYAKEYSHQTQQKIDQQIMQIIQQCSIRTRAIITQKKQMISKLAELLLKQQTIDQRMIQSVLGQRPFKSSKQYEQYIRERQKLKDDEQQIKNQGGTIAGSTTTFSCLKKKYINKLSMLL